MLTDADIGAGVTIDSRHHMIHAGYAYTGSFTTSCAANTSAAEVLLIRTPSTTLEKATHFMFDTAIAGVQPGQVRLLELNAATAGINTTGAGTTVALYNNDRSSTNTTLVTLKSVTVGNAFTTGTISVGNGTPIWQTNIPANQKLGNNSLLGQNEFLLKSATTYALVYEGFAGTTSVTHNVYFYKQAAIG